MINASEIIETTAQHVRKLLEGEGSGHDWWHIQRVWDLSKRLSQSEPVNVFVIELAALLHDIADHKFHDGDETVGPKVARKWLERLQVDEPVVLHVTEIVKDLSFKGAGGAYTHENTRRKNCTGCRPAGCNGGHWHCPGICLWWF